jgi:hypothetical protein
MANKSFFETLTQYRLRVEKDGKDVVNVSSIFALPGLLMAPKLSITGLIAAPLLGLKVHLESEDGEAVDMEEAVRKAAEAVKESVVSTTKTIKEEMDKAWEAVSSDYPEEDVTEDAEENEEAPEEKDVSNDDIVEELKAHEENDTPTIEVKPDDSDKA